MATDQAQTASGAAEMTAASWRDMGLDSCLHTAILCTPGSRGAEKCLYGAVAVHSQRLRGGESSLPVEHPAKKACDDAVARHFAHVHASVNARSWRDGHSVTAEQPGGIDSNLPFEW